MTFDFNCCFQVDVAICTVALIVGVEWEGSEGGTEIKRWREQVHVRVKDTGRTKKKQVRRQTGKYIGNLVMK